MGALRFSAAAPLRFWEIASERRRGQLGAKEPLCAVPEVIHGDGSDLLGTSDFSLVETLK